MIFLSDEENKNHPEPNISGLSEYNKHCVLIVVQSDIIVLCTIEDDICHSVLILCESAYAKINEIKQEVRERNSKTFYGFVHIFYRKFEDCVSLCVQFEKKIQVIPSMCLLSQLTNSEMTQKQTDNR